MITGVVKKGLVLGIIVVMIGAGIVQNIKTTVKADPTEGLVGYWSFDEGTGTIANDSSGNGNDATVYGGATWVTGKSSYALSFDGINDYGEVLDNNNLEGMSKLTIGLWVKIDQDNTGRDVLVSKWEEGIGPYEIQIDGTRRIDFWIYTTTGWYELIGSHTILEIGGWHSIVGVYDGISQKLYLDGVVTDSQSVSGTLTSNNYPLNIGRSPSLYNNYFNGIIDEVKIFTRVLNDTEIFTVYASSGGLVGYWSFDEGNGNIAHDSSENGNEGTILGPSWTTGYSSNALSFDGVNDKVVIPHDEILSIDGSFTIEAWVKRDTSGLGALQYIVSKDVNQGSLPYSNYNLLFETSNKITLYLKGLNFGIPTKGTLHTDAGGGGIIGVTAVVDAGWHHIKGIYTGTELQVYLDGALDGAVPVTGIPSTNSDDVWIGARKHLSNPEGFFKGIIDEVKIYSTAVDMIFPGKIINLAPYNPTDYTVTLTWTAPGDDGNVGTASNYDIRYKNSPITEDNWDNANQVLNEPSPNPPGSSESFTVSNLNPGTTYYFAMKTGDEIPHWSELSNCVKIETANTNNQELISYWAPVWYQDTDTDDYIVDCITNFDYDGNYRGSDNSENLDAGFPLKAYVYYWLVETETNWFIGYADFHPRDCKPGLEHENDMEGVLLVIQKDGSQYGQFLVMITLNHLNFYSYKDFDTAPSSNVNDGAKPILGDVEFQDLHPIVYVDSLGHAVSGDYRWEDNGFPGGDGIIYIPSDVAEEPGSGSDNNVGYELLDINILYEKANDFTYRFESWGVFKSPDYWKAHAPWLWDDTDISENFPPGALFYDPVSLVDTYHTGLGSYASSVIYRSYDSADVQNPLLAEEQTGFNVMVELDKYYEKIKTYVVSNADTIIGLANPFMENEEREEILSDLTDGFPKPDFVEDIEESIIMYNHFIETIINEERTVSFTPHLKGTMIDFHSYKYLLEEVYLPSGVNQIDLTIIDNGVEVKIFAQQTFTIRLEKLIETIDDKDTDVLKISFTIENINQQDIRLDFNLYIYFSIPIGAFSEIILDTPAFLINIIFNDPFSKVNQFKTIGMYLGFSLDGYSGVGGGIELDGGMFMSGKTEDMDLSKVDEIVGGFNSCLESHGVIQTDLDIQQMLHNVFTIGDCVKSSLDNIPDSLRFGGEFGVSGKLGLGAGGSAGAAGAKASVDGKGTISASGSIPVSEFIALNMDLYNQFLVSNYESIDLLLKLNEHLENLETMEWYEICLYIAFHGGDILQAGWDTINAFYSSHKVSEEILQQYSDFLLDETIVSAQLETGLGAGAAAGLELGSDVTLIPGVETNLRTIASLFALDFSTLTDEGYFGVYVKASSEQEKNLGLFGIKIVDYKDIFKATIKGKNTGVTQKQKMEDRRRQNITVTNLIDKGVDTDADGLYNYLQINFTADFPSNSQYSIIGMLFENYSCIGSSALNQTFNQGVQNVSLLFDGLHLRNQMMNGSYALDLIICNNNNHELLYYNYDIYNTSSYNYTDFQNSSTVIKEITAEGMDINHNMLFDYLVVNASVDSDADEEVHVISILQSDGFTLQNESQMNLSIGMNTIPCVFNGTVIRQNGVNSPYQFTIVLYNSTGIRIGKETFSVESFVFSDFDFVNCSLNNTITDSGVDCDSDGLFDYLIIDVGVDVSVPGLYTVSLDLVGNNSVFSISNTSYLEENGYVLLYIDGALIRGTGLNQSYAINQLVLSDNNQLYGTRDFIGNTSVWNSSDFSYQKAWLNEEYFDYVIDIDDDGLFDYLVVDVGVKVYSTDVYKVSGFLDCSGSNVYAENYEYLPVGSHEVKLWFDGIRINEIGQQHWYHLVDVGLLLNGSIIALDDFAYDIQLVAANFSGSAKGAPLISCLYPLNNSLSVARPPSFLNFSLMDLDLQMMNASVWWYNHTGHLICLGSYENVIDGIFSISGFSGSDWIWGNTTYIWSVNVTDGTSWTNETYQYTTGGSRYDINNNNIVNFQDAGLVWVHRTSLVPYDGLYDVNQDGNVNFQDAGLTWIHRD